MSPIWISFFVLVGGTLLVIAVFIAGAWLMDRPSRPHTTLYAPPSLPATRQLSPHARELSERLTQRRQEIIAEQAKRDEQAKRAARAQEIGTGVLKTIDDLYEMAHGKRHEG